MNLEDVRLQGRKLMVLMWKHLLVRKRRFIHTPIEILSPLVFFIVIYYVKPDLSKEHGAKADLRVLEANISELESPWYVFYTPKTPFTKKLMDEVGKQLGLKEYTTDSTDSYDRYYVPYDDESEIKKLWQRNKWKSFKVLFHTKDENTKKLSYTVVVREDRYDSTADPNEELSSGSDYNSFIRLQSTIDTSFIKILTNKPVSQRLSVHEFPRFGGVYVGIMQSMGVASIWLCWASLFLVFIFFVSRLLEDRTTGIQEMITMVGVSTNLLGVSHFLNVMPAGLVYSIGSAVFMTTVFPNSDGLLIFFIQLLYFISVVAFAFPCSYILQGSRFTTTLTMFVYLSVLFPAYFADMYAKSRASILATGLLPHAPMIWLWKEIAAKETYGEFVSFANAGIRHTLTSGSVGKGAAFLMLQTLLYFMLTWYLSQVRPGKYGQARPWNFLFKNQYWFKSEDIPVLVDDEDTSVVREAKYFEESPKNLETGIKIENVTKIFPKQKALSNVSLEVYKGEITVLLGHNGAGKTTLMSIITGMTSATEGRILVEGVDTSVGERARQQLGLCPQHNLFFNNLSVLEHVMFFTLLKGVSFKVARRESLELLRTLRIEDKANVQHAALSGGMKRRLQLACALAGGASVLVLDEPTSGLDVETRRELWDLLLSLRGSRTVLLTTHFMEEADALGDRVAALHQGRLRCHATPMYLKKAIGNGYRLSFTTTGPPREKAVTAAVTSHVPEATLKEKTINSLSYNLPATWSGIFPNLFSSIEDKKVPLGIETIGVGVSTLEEVFLKLCSDTDTTFLENEINNPSSHLMAESTGAKVTGAALYLRQFIVLIKRQCKYTWHNKYLFLIMQILLPIILIVVITVGLKDPKMTSSVSFAELSLDVDLYDRRDTRVILCDVAGDMQAMRTTWPEVDFRETKTVLEDVSNAKDSTEYLSYLAGIELNNTQAQALYSSKFLYAAPVAVNLLSNVLAAQYIGADAGGRIIHTYLQTEDRDININQELIHSIKRYMMVVPYAACIVLVILASSITNVSLPCSERVSGARHIHMMSGCPAVLYWATTCLFHLSLCAVFLITTVAATAAAFDHYQVMDLPTIMNLVVVLLLGSLAFLGLMYFLSCYFEMRGATIILTALLMTGIVTAFVVEMQEIFFIHSEKKEAKTGITFSDFLVGLISVTIPSYATVVAFVKSIVTAYTTHTGTHNDRDKDALDKMASDKELIILTAQIIVYMTLVMLSQLGIMNSVADHVFNSSFRKQASRKNENDDEIVRAEANYVEKQITLPKGQIESSEAMLVSDLQKNYYRLFSKSCNAVQGVSLSVKKGECFGLLGVNGAGKSTTFKMLTAEECPTMGDIYANGHFKREKQPYLRSLGYCPQFFGLDDFQTGRENLTLLLTLRGFDSADVTREVASWIDVVGLEKYIDRRVAEYSGGCKRRLAAAAALSSAAPLTLLDEPTAGVDVSARRRVWSALQRGQRQGRAVIITSHSMDEMEALCSRIAIMSGGVVRALGTPSELRANHATGHAVLIKMTQLCGIGANDAERAKLAIEKFKNAMHSSFNCTLKDEHKSMLHYHINESMRYSELFSALEQLKEQYRALVEDYCVTETTLEEVFLHIAKEQNQRKDQQLAQEPRRRWMNSIV